MRPINYFVFLILLAIGFAVCYAAPPPDPVIDVTAASYLDAEIQPMLVATPCTHMQDQQPAPLLFAAIVPREISMPMCVEIKQPPWFNTAVTTIDLYDNEGIHLSLDKDTDVYIRYCPIENHSSGGMPG